MIKPKNGEYQCLHCEAHVEGRFATTDTVFCYLCGNQMLVKDLVKIEKPKEIKIKPLNNGITGAFVKYDYGPDSNGQMKVSNITFNGIPYTYKGKGKEDVD
jgi:DNA-directed RNA polymerase subunit RPC12/RpoP